MTDWHSKISEAARILTPGKAPPRWVVPYLTDMAERALHLELARRRAPKRVQTSENLSKIRPAAAEVVRAVAADGWLRWFLDEAGKGPLRLPVGFTETLDEISERAAIAEKRIGNGRGCARALPGAVPKEQRPTGQLLVACAALAAAERLGAGLSETLLAEACEALFQAAGGKPAKDCSVARWTNGYLPAARKLPCVGSGPLLPQDWPSLRIEDLRAMAMGIAFATIDPAQTNSAK